MGSSEKFCLRWNDFESNISVAFRELREEKDFFDVTLACDDSQIQAHKVILSACSPFFRNVLRRNPHQHPLLYLKGVKYQELLSVLNFMYMGEVNVAQEELNSFLAVAEDLRVKGLTQNNPGTGSSSKQEPTKQNHRVAREPPDREAVQPAPKRPRPTPPPPTPRAPYNPPQQNVQEADDDIQEVVPVKSEPRDAVVVQEPQQYQHQSNTVEVQGRQQGVAQNTEVALDTEQYGEESYDYGQYGDGTYDDGGAGVIDPNTGLPMQQGDGTKVELNSPKPSSNSHLLLEPTIMIHHPADRGLEEGEEDLLNMSMDCSDCYANPDQDWQREVAVRMTKDNNVWHCVECSYMSKNKTSVVSHVQGKHLKDFGGYVCKICGSNSGTYCGFEKHMARQHSFSLAKKNILAKPAPGPMTLTDFPIPPDFM